MKSKQPCLHPGKLGLVLGAMLVATLTGCVTYVDRAQPGEVYVAPPVQVVVEDDYVYYPNYEIYYSSSRHQYAYRDGRNWVSRPAPRGVSVDVLFASPSVRMNFHDSPAQHHAAVAKQYPKNWSPPAQKQTERKEDRKDDQHDQHGDNHGR
ncbi:MAG: hypothetical protein P4N60_23230 [Verrucomicrobiae bacterium]|nr:hypothetical protein [Verrucomicrobiae bacterium]